MIKALVVERRFSRDCGEWDEIFDDPGRAPKLPGAVLEEWIKLETFTPTTVKQFKNEARLREDGTPYIHSWSEFAPEHSYEEWCKKGFDHTETRTEENGWPKWTYTRYSTKTRWVIVIETLEQLEELLDAGAELTNEHYYYMPDIEYVLRIYE